MPAELGPAGNSPPGVGGATAFPAGGVPRRRRRRRGKREPRPSRPRACPRWRPEFRPFSLPDRKPLRPAASRAPFPSSACAPPLALPSGLTRKARVGCLPRAPAAPGPPSALTSAPCWAQPRPRSAGPAPPARPPDCPACLALRGSVHPPDFQEPFPLASLPRPRASSSLSSGPVFSGLSYVSACCCLKKKM